MKLNQKLYNSIGDKIEAATDKMRETDNHDVAKLYQIIEEDLSKLDKDSDDYQILTKLYATLRHRVLLSYGIGYIDELIANANAWNMRSHDYFYYDVNELRQVSKYGHQLGQWELTFAGRHKETEPRLNQNKIYPVNQDLHEVAKDIVMHMYNRRWYSKRYDAEVNKMADGIKRRRQIDNSSSCVVVNLYFSRFQYEYVEKWIQAGQPDFEYEFPMKRRI